MPRKPPLNSPTARPTTYTPDRDTDTITSLRLQADRLANKLTGLYSAALRRRALYFRRRPSTGSSGSGAVQRGYDEGRGSTGRPEGQAFRSIAAIPLVQRTVESKAAALAALICKPDPLVDCDATTDANYGDAARFATRMVSWALYRNKFRSKLISFFRDVGTDGTKWIQTYWRRDISPVYLPYSDKELEDWQARVLEAANTLEVEPPDIPADVDPELWQRWIDDVNKSGRLAKPIPDMPMTGKTVIKHYEGPAIRGLYYADVLVHPEQDWEDQRVVVQRQWVPVEQLRAMAGTGPDQPLNRSALEYAIGMGAKWGGGDQTRNAYLERHFSMLGVEREPALDEQTYGGLVLIETFYRRHDPEPFILLANRAAIVNKDRQRMPFMHGRIPLLPLRLCHIDGTPFGLSSVQQTEPIAYESNRIIAHVLDAMLLAILPVFTRLKDVPWPARLLRLSAGQVIPVPRHDVLQALTKSAPPDLNGALQLVNWLAGWNDDAEATPAVTRGSSSSQGGRPSATSVVQDLAQATNRIWSIAVEAEDDLDEIPRQFLGLMYENFEPGQRVYVGGQGDPYVNLSKDQLARVLDMDFNFRGATRSINRELLVNALMTFGAKFGQTMLASEVRALASSTWDEMGLRRKDEVLNPAQTEVLRKKDEIAVKAAAMQLAPNSSVDVPQQPGAPPAPTAPVGPGAAAPPPSPAPAGAQPVPAEAGPEQGGEAA